MECPGSISGSSHLGYTVARRLQASAVPAPASPGEILLSLLSLR